MDESKQPKITLLPEEQSLSPTIRHTPIGEVEIVHVLRPDLSALRNASDKETRATVFFGVVAGMLISSLLTWLGIDFDRSVAVAFLAMFNIVSFVMTAWFGLEWRAARQEKQDCLDRIEDKSLSSRTLLRVEQSSHAN
jgi:hypothetical protein